MDWLRMLSVLLILLFFEGEVMAGSRQKIRIHIPQKVKHIHHHKKIYITKYPASDIGTLQHYGITNGQYAPGFTSTSESIPNGALSESRIGSLTPNLLPMYRARGHYGPPPVYSKTKRATKTRRGKRTKVIKLSPARRKRVSRKKVNKKHRDSKKNNTDKENYFNSQRESSYRDYYAHYDTPYEMSESYPTRYKYKKPKRVQKYVDKDGEHVHTYSEEHIHQIIYDDPPYHKQDEEEDNDYKSYSNYFTKDDVKHSTMPLGIALQDAYQAGNPSASSNTYSPQVYFQPPPLPSTNDYNNHQTSSSANNHYLNSKKPVIIQTFPLFYPSGYKKQQYGSNPVTDGTGSLGTPLFMEYMDYDPNDATHDHTVHDHGELPSKDYPENDNYDGDNKKYKSNPFLNSYYNSDNKKPQLSSWSSNTNGYKPKRKNLFDSSGENTKESLSNYQTTKGSFEDSLHSNQFKDYSNKHVTSVSYGNLPSKESVTKIPDLYYDQESSSEHYLTTTRQPSTKSHRFRQKQNIVSTKLYPSSSSVEEDDQENIYKLKSKFNYFTTETPTTAKSIPNEFQGVFDQTLYTEKLKSPYNGHTSVEGTAATFSNENSYGGTKDQFRDSFSQSPYRPILKNSYGQSTPETLEYELGFLSKKKHRYGESSTPSYSKKSTKSKGKGQSMSSQTISFGGQDHTTIVNHFGDRSSTLLELSSREARDDDTSPSALTYDNIILTNEFNAQSSNLNTNTPEIDLSSFNNVEKPKLSDLVFTEKSFSSETTTLPGSAAPELSSVLSPSKSPLRPSRKFRRTGSSIFKPKSSSRTKVSRKKSHRNDDIEETTQFSYTTYSPGRGLKYGDRVSK